MFALLFILKEEMAECICAINKSRGFFDKAFKKKVLKKLFNMNSSVF
jgi:hypothetical protein